MRATLLCLLCACSAGYRTPEDSEPMRRRIEDRNTASRVRVALARDPEAARYRSIRVRCENGTVTLEGSVDSAQAKARAVAVASRCEGVRRVTDLVRASG